MDFAGAIFKFHSDSGAWQQNFIVKNYQQIIIQNNWLADFCKSRAWLHDLMNNGITNDWPEEWIVHISCYSYLEDFSEVWTWEVDVNSYCVSLLHLFTDDDASSSVDIVGDYNFKALHSQVESQVLCTNLTQSPIDSLLGRSLLIMSVRSWTTSDIGGLNSGSDCKISLWLSKGDPLFRYVGNKIYDYN